MRRRKDKLLLSGIALMTFLMLIMLLQAADVGAIGPQGTSVGLSTINGKIHSLFDLNMTWYRISTLLGYAALATVPCCLLLGLAQMISRRSLFKADRGIYALAGLYVLTALIYLLFEKVVINYRPVLLPGTTEPAPSFPSTHTMLACVLFGSAAIQAKYSVTSERLRYTIQAACGILALATVAARVLSGVHWITDILGSLLLSASLLLLFAAAAYQRRHHHHHHHHSVDG